MVKPGGRKTHETLNDFTEPKFRLQSESRKTSFMKWDRLLLVVLLLLTIWNLLNYGCTDLINTHSLRLCSLVEKLPNVNAWDISTKLTNKALKSTNIQKLVPWTKITKSNGIFRAEFNWNKGSNMIPITWPCNFMLNDIANADFQSNDNDLNNHFVWHSVQNNVSTFHFDPCDFFAWLD